MSRRLARVGDFAGRITYNVVLQNFSPTHHLPHMDNCISEQDQPLVRKEVFHNNSPSVHTDNTTHRTGTVIAHE